MQGLAILLRYTLDINFFKKCLHKISESLFGLRAQQSVCLHIGWSNILREIVM